MNLPVIDFMLYIGNDFLLAWMHNKLLLYLVKREKNPSQIFFSSERANSEKNNLALSNTSFRSPG